MGTGAFSALIVVLAVAQGNPPPGQRDSLELRGWLELARERSPAVAAAAAGIREAAARRRVARSGRGPQLQLNGLYLRFRDPPSLTLGPAGSYAPITANTYLLQTQVVQPLYTGGRLSAAVRAAEWLQKAAESSKAATDVELSAAIAHAYDDVLVARSLTEVAKASVKVLEEAVRVAEEHYAAGTVARLDVLRAETRLSSARAAVRASRVAEAVARERLAALAGIDPDSAPQVTGTLDYLPLSVDVKALLARARSVQPQIQALHALASGYDASAAAATAARRPAVSLYAMSLVSRPELVSGESRWAWELLGGVSLNWSFFDSGRAGGRADAARAAAERAEAEAAQAVDASVAAVRAETLELARAEEDVRAGRETVGRAERALRVAQERYTEGVGMQLEVLEAEADLTAGRADLLRAIHAHRSATIELRRAAGLPADASLPGLRMEGRP